MTLIYNKVTVIGMGLIGASIALSIRRGGLAGKVVGSDCSTDVAKTVARLKITDQFEADPATAIKDADLVIVAVPVGAVGRLAEQIFPLLKSGAVLTDTGSTKTSYCEMWHALARGYSLVAITPARRNRTFGTRRRI